MKSERPSNFLLPGNKTPHRTNRSGEPTRRTFPAFLLVRVLVLTWLLPSYSAATNAPVTTLASVGNAVPGLVQVPVTVTGFSGIGAISLTLDYLYGGVQFVQGVPHPSLQGFVSGDQDLGNGKHRVTMGWFGTGTTLPDGSAIITLQFQYNTGNTALQFYDNGPSCEYADENFNVLDDIPQSSFYIDGAICGTLAAPGPVAGSSIVCQSQTGVSYSVPPVTNATGYAWTVPPGALIISGTNTNLILVDFSASAQSGVVTVQALNACGQGPAGQKPVTVVPLPVANAGPDQVIPYGTSTTLQASSGGTGIFAYHWTPESLVINPNNQSTQTVNLTSTSLFHLTVTESTAGCRNDDEVVVTITGGPLTGNPTAVPTVVCQGIPSQLFANAGGGSGNYTYSWSCTPPGNPPWSSGIANPVVSPSVTTVYTLSLSDGFNIATGSCQVTVLPLPTATISGGDTLCGPGHSTDLTVMLTGTPLWNLYYTNGVTTWFSPNINASPLILNVTEPGIYTLPAVTDANCTGTTSGSAPVAVNPIPPTPTIQVNGSELSSSGCCGNQWYREGLPIPGATGQSYLPLQTAHYYTIVTVDGCSSDTSNTIYFLMQGYEDASAGLYEVSPNPARDYIHFRAKTDDPAEGVLTLVSQSGTAVWTSRVNGLLSGSGMTIAVRQLSPGLYLLVYTGSGRSSTFRVIVR